MNPANRSRRILANAVALLAIPCIYLVMKNTRTRPWAFGAAALTAFVWGAIFIRNGCGLIRGTLEPNSKRGDHGPSMIWGGVGMLFVGIGAVCLALPVERGRLELFCGITMGGFGVCVVVAILTRLHAKRSGRLPMLDEKSRDQDA